LLHQQEDLSVSILIFANGDVDNVKWIRPYLEKALAVIAADGGLSHLVELGYQPDVIIGDLDSLEPQAKAWLESDETAVYVYPRDKDETDLELALLHAVAHYEDDIHIIGAIGGRLDQTLGNIMLLAHPALAGRRVELITEYQRAWLVTSSTEITGEVGDTVSLVPAGGDVLVTETTGLRWPLDNETLSVGPARGLSNIMVEPLATVSISSGKLLCIHTKKSWDR
jgi:thiamine pyrophosphokinase